MRLIMILLHPNQIEMQIAPEEGGRGCAVDVVVAEDRHALLLLDRLRDAVGGFLHVGEAGGIGHQVANAR